MDTRYKMFVLYNDIRMKIRDMPNVSIRNNGEKITITCDENKIYIKKIDNVWQTTVQGEITIEILKIIEEVTKEINNQIS